MAFNSYGLKGITMDYKPDGWTWYVAECEKVENVTLGDEFEISAQIYFNNCTTAHMGAIKVKLEENGEEKVHLNVGDCWAAENKVQMYAMIDSSTIADNQNLSKNNGSGRYAIIGDGEKVYFYWGETLLGSIDYTENISYDKIVIQFLRYPGYNMQPMYLESLYVGEPLYYKSMINK